MSHDNPYAVSELYSKREFEVDGFDPLDPKQFRVEPPFIVCGKKVQLPEVCAISGETEDLVPTRKTIQLKSWKFQVFRRQCEASFFLSRRMRRRMRYAFFGGFLTSLAGIALGVVGAQPQNPDILIIATSVVLFLAGAWLLLRGSLPLVMSRHERGRKYWLTGFSPEFFKSLQRVPNDPADHHGEIS